MTIHTNVHAARSLADVTLAAAIEHYQPVRWEWTLTLSEVADLISYVAAE